MHALRDQVTNQPMPTMPGRLPNNNHNISHRLSALLLLHPTIREGENPEAQVVAAAVVAADQADHKLYHS